MKRRSVFWTALVAVVLIILVLLLAVLMRRPGVRAVRQGGGEAATAVTWDGPTTCYPARMVAESLRLVRAIPGFGPVSPAQHAELAAAATRLSQKYGVQLRASQLASMRNLEIAQIAQRSGTRALRLGEEIAAAVRAGEPILAIADRHKLPPLTVLRQALSEEGYGPAQIRDVLANPERLPARLAAEAPAIFEADLGSRLNAARIKEKSQAYEDAVGAHLHALGLSFQTEEDLRREQVAATGAPVITPDFLFTRPVAINGHPIVWLDAKDYPAIDSGLVRASLAKQAAKYTARFGPGAFVYSGGVMCDSKTARLGPLLLDGSHIRSRPTGA
jgi:hypothetical protein